MATYWSLVGIGLSSSLCLTGNKPTKISTELIKPTSIAAAAASPESKTNHNECINIRGVYPGREMDKCAKINKANCVDNGSGKDIDEGKNLWMRVGRLL